MNPCELLTTLMYPSRSDFGLPGKEPNVIPKEQRREPTPNLHNRNTSTYGVRRVVATLEFIQHDLA